MSDTELEPQLPPEPVAATGGRARRRRHSTRRNTIEWIVVIGGALIVALVIKTFLFQAFYIPSSSMEPTLKVGDRVLVNKLSYRLHDIGRGDIVVFRRPSDTNETISVEGCDGHSVTITRTSAFAQEKVDDLIKRVVALPGETVEQKDGKILVNGAPLPETYLQPGVTTPPFSFTGTGGGTSQCIKVPEHEVFVLGDNRQNSQASNAFGPIDEDLIVGRAFIRVWPLGSFGGI